MINDNFNILKRAFLEVEAKKLVKYDSLPEATEDFSPKFIGHMDKLIRYHRKPYWKFTNTAPKKAIAVLIAVFMLFSISMSVSAIREPVIEFFVNVYETFTEFFIRNEKTETPDTIEKIYQIIELPDGYVADGEYGDKINIQTKWTNGDNNIVFSQTVLNNNDVRIDTENKKYSSKIIDNITIYYVEQKGTKIILWLTSEYSFSIVCPDELDWNTIEIMIKSIK